MLSIRNRRVALATGMTLGLLSAFLVRGVSQAADPAQAGVVRCANLVYDKDKSSVCFSAEFLAQIQRDTHVLTEPQFQQIRLESLELYQFPFAVMSGEGAFRLTEPQRENLRNYLNGGGFVVASAGCSSPEWSASLREEVARVFPDAPLTRLDVSHPIFHTVYDIKELDGKKRAAQPYLEGLEIDGRIALVISADGLNDTGKVGGNCCCCGGNEIGNARQVNVNLLAYALTH